MPLTGRFDLGELSEAERRGGWDNIVHYILGEGENVNDVYGELVNHIHNRNMAVKAAYKRMNAHVRGGRVAVHAGWIRGNLNVPDNVRRAIERVESSARIPIRRGVDNNRR